MIDENTDKQTEFIKYALPLISAIARWESLNGTIAAIQPFEYADFCEKLSDAAVLGSARAALSAIDKAY